MKRTLCGAAVACGLAQSASATPREVQIRSIDFENSIVEIFSFSSETEDLTGWRLCTHDDDQVRQYTSPMAPRTISPGQSIYLYWNNDAPGGDPDRINIADLGGFFAGPLDRGPFSIGLYFPGHDGIVMFSDPFDMIDSIQWSIDGLDNNSADERSDEAELAGLWIDQSLWIATTPVSLSIMLTDATGGLLHGPKNYQVNEPVVCLADTNHDGMVTPADFTAWIAAFNADAPECDQNTDGQCTPADFTAWIANFNAGCG
ncbi:MAG TPA: hypothetical protein ENJ00_08180 [Phycisphaerales bacterium]|nr:hypothetical protein [Phycisphaerales bacterium]